MAITLEPVAITAGAGTNVAVDTVNQGGTDYQVQVIKLLLGDDAAADGYASLTYPVPVDNAATAVTLYNVTMTLVNTEYSQALPTTCRRLAFKNRAAKDMRFAFVTGKVATPTAPYMTLKANTTYDSGQIHLAGATLYVAGTQAANVVEIEAWS